MLSTTNPRERDCFRTADGVKPKEDDTKKELAKETVVVNESIFISEFAILRSVNREVAFGAFRSIFESFDSQKADPYFLHAPFCVRYVLWPSREQLEVGTTSKKIV